MCVGALVGLAVLGVGQPRLASSAKTTSGMLEMVENMLHKGRLGWQMRGAPMEVAGELGARSDGPLGLHGPPSSDDGVLLTLHGLVEEEWVGGRHLGDWGVDGWEIGVFFGAVAIGTRAHVTVLGRPVFEPVVADGAAGTVRCDLVQVEFDDKVAKGREDVCASLLGAGEDGLAG